MLYLSQLFICFIVFSFLGWCLEVAYGCAVLKKFVNRGFLIGPLCPLYGLGCVLLYSLLRSYSSDLIMLALASMALCSILEYLASFIMEKIFKTRWWDYTDMKFNINGRICLEMAVPFGILGILVVNILFPFALKILNMIPAEATYIIAAIILVLFIVDLILSCEILSKFKEITNLVPKDMTEEITKFARETLSKQSILTRRLVESFPNFKIVKTIKKIIPHKKEKQ